MKFMFVVGGSYKSFYLNQLKNINKIDLLIFNQNIFYDFNYEQEYLDDNIVTQELIMLNKKLNCPIIVYGKYKFFNKEQKCFILCVNGKVSVINRTDDIYLYIKGKMVLIGNKLYKKTKTFSTISMLDSRPDLQVISKNLPLNYFVCDKTGVSRLQYDKIYRKFQKYCYFSLCFHKKMI